MSNLIDRQAAIELIERMKSYHQDADDIAEMIANMPSAQPVLTCKGCKYDYYEYAGCRNCLRKERDLYEPE
jgi:hypothetical protein